MRRALYIVASATLAFAPWTVAQTPNGQAAADQATATADATIPKDQQATREQLKTLFEVMRLRQQFDAMMKMLPNYVQQQVHAQMEEMTAKLPDDKKPTPEQKIALDKVMRKYMDKAQTIYPAGEMIEDAITIYQRHMSRPDVEAYIAFFNSAPGQHLLDAQPKIAKEYMPVAMERAQARSKELFAQMAVDMEAAMKPEAPTK
jgi:hypothetical protein